MPYFATISLNRTVSSFLTKQTTCNENLLHFWESIDKTFTLSSKKFYFAILTDFFSISEPILNCTGPNEEYCCDSPCQRECQYLGRPCPFVNVQCNRMCYCKPNYARDCDCKCIPQKDCPKTKCPKSCTVPDPYPEQNESYYW